MKTKIPCAMIKDIMPTYLDELTSRETNEMIEEHLKECEACSKLFADMKEPKTDEMEENKETVEIDFLKKSRKRSKRILKISVLSDFKDYQPKSNSALTQMGFRLSIRSNISENKIWYN